MQEMSAGKLQQVTFVLPVRSRGVMEPTGKKPRICAWLKRRLQKKVEVRRAGVGESVAPRIRKEEKNHHKRKNEP